MKRPTAQHDDTYMDPQRRMLHYSISWTDVYYYNVVGLVYSFRNRCKSKVDKRFFKPIHNDKRERLEMFKPDVPR